MKRKSKITGLAAAVAAAIAGSLYIATKNPVPPTPPPPPPTGAANLWASNAGTTTCVRSATKVDYATAHTNNNDCDTPVRAWSKTTTCSGTADNVLVKSGTWSAPSPTATGVALEFDKNTNLSSCTGNVTVAVAVGNTVQINGILQLGSRSSGLPPNHLTISGCQGTSRWDAEFGRSQLGIVIDSVSSTGSGWTGGISAPYHTSTGTRSDSNLVECVSSVTGDRMDTGYPINAESVLNTTFDHIYVGGVCCGSVSTGTSPPCDPTRYGVAGACSANSPVGMRAASLANSNPTNDGLSLLHSTIQYILRSCTFWPTSVLGACPSGEVVNGSLITLGTGCPNITTASGQGDTCHVDGSQLYTQANGTYMWNNITNDDVQALFLEHTNCTHPCESGNNKIMFNWLGVNPGGNCGFCVSVNNTTPIEVGGSWKVWRNTSNTQCRIGWAGAILSGTTIDYRGNVCAIANPSATGSGANCTGGTGVTWTYAYNFEMGSAGPCDATDAHFTASLSTSLVVQPTNGTATLPDFHLTGSGANVSGTLARNFIPASDPSCGGQVDFDGNTLPLGTGCEPGAGDIP